MVGLPFLARQEGENCGGGRVQYSYYRQDFTPAGKCDILQEFRVGGRW